MRRLIEFRGKSVDTGQWVYGPAFMEAEGLCGLFHSDDDGHPEVTEVERETVGEFSGRRDDAGTHIYEHDIVRHGAFSSVVGFDNGSFVLRDLVDPDSNAVPIAIVQSMLIIGNTIDHPQLIAQLKEEAEEAAEVAA